MAEARTCKRCGRPVDKWKQYCKSCHQERRLQRELDISSGICERCHNSIDPPIRGKKFCQNCRRYGKYQRVPTATTLNRCKCGRDLEPGSKSNYCKVCQNRHHRDYEKAQEKKKKITKIIICKKCGAEVVVTADKTRKYCQDCTLKIQRETGQSTRKSLTLPHNIHVCSYCGKEFHRVYGGYKRNKDRTYFCSQECRLKGTVPKSIKICPNCQKSFKSNSNKYCSPECWHAARKAQSGKTLQAVTCKWCGVEFYRYKSEIKSGHGTYCSKDCQHKGRAALDMNWPYRMKHDIYSQAELVIAKELTEHGISFEHNFYIPHYFVDFLLSGYLIIECDPVICTKDIHSHCKHTAEKEQVRDEYLQSLGYTVIRYNDDDIFNHAAQVIKLLVQDHNLNSGQLVETKIPGLSMVRETAKKLEVSENRIIDWCNQGGFVGATRQNGLGRAWLIPDASIELVQEQISRGEIIVKVSSPPFWENLILTARGNKIEPELVTEVLESMQSPGGFTKADLQKICQRIITKKGIPDLSKEYLANRFFGACRNRLTKLPGHRWILAL